MSKTRRRNNERDYYDGDYESRQETKNKKLERRIERALRVGDVEELTVEDGIDPDYFDYMVEEELMDLQNADVQFSK
jgi:hypothetical protein